MTRARPAARLPPGDYAAIFAAMPIPCLLLDPDLRIAAVNSAYLHIFPARREALLGRPVLQVFPASHELQASLERVRARHEADAISVRPYDIALPRADGGDPRRYWSLVHAPLLDDCGQLRYIMQIVEDFTDTVRLQREFLLDNATPEALRERMLRLERDMLLRARERQDIGDALRRASESLRRLDEAKDSFLGSLGHELRTPLTLIVGPIEELLHAEPPLPPQHLVELETMHRNALRLRKAINMLLDFSRAQAGLADALYEPVDLSAYTLELASLFRSAIENAGLDFRVNCAPLPETVYVDRGFWETIVLNLLSNAFKFTLQGRIELTLRARQQGIELAVHDSGCGIPPQELPRVFERFHRIEAAQCRSAEGTGIGLALTRELVLLHGGSIRAESTPGRGTSIFVELPFGHAHLPERQLGPPALPFSRINGAIYVEEAQGWLADACEAPAPEATPAMPPARILLIEGNADMRRYLARLLGHAHTVDAVADASAAFAAIGRQAPDLVVTDASLAGMNGLAVVRHLRNDPATAALPILILADKASEEDRLASIDAGASDYLAKPFTAHELRARIAGLFSLGKLIRHEVHVAQHDSLTGLPNRKLFHEDAERVLAWGQRLKQRCAVFFIDLDEFKPINDRHGHDTGDRLLQAVAERLARCLRTEDLVGRYGGDEFLALLAGIETAQDVARVAGNMLTALRAPCPIDEASFRITASIGISLYPDDGENIDTLIQHADQAMYAAKRAGRNRFAFHGRDGPPADGSALPAAD